MTANQADDTIAGLSLGMNSTSAGALGMNPFLEYLKQAAQIESIDSPLRVLGIDLGTTNSTAAEIVWSPDQAGPPEARCLAIDQPTEEGRYTHVLVPSMVARSEDRIWVGEGAKRLRARSPERNLERGRDLFWECKNDMGLQRTYNRAPPGFRSAREVSGHILRFLMDAVRTDDDRPLDRVVITVPASFQTAQRHDTTDAARLAGLELVGGDLVDEPVAAFLDYGFTHGLDNLGKPGEHRNLLVFDFGGGTCDVALFRTQLPRPGERLQITPLAVSRYHRLGGGDIDAAIVYEVLLPQILRQNQLGTFDLTFKDKKEAIEPAFLGVAEALKILLCKEVTRLNKFGKYRDADKEAITVKNPGAHFCQLKDGRRLSLQSPSLSAARFLELLGPFLDRDVLAARETEYRLTCSIFGPLSDALDRSGLRPEEIDLCLLVGGSSLILPVQQTIASYFPRARLLTYEDADAVQTAVARGGAYHALLLAATGKGVLQPVASDALHIQTDAGPIELIPAHALLPYPAQDRRWEESKRLRVPRGSKREPVELRVELLDAQGALLAGCVWEIPAPVEKGTPLLLRYRLDENQELEMTLGLADGADDAAFTLTIENPLTHVVNPSRTRARIDQLEEDLRTNRVPRPEWPEKLEELAGLHEELNQLERALDLLRNAVRARGAPSPWLLNHMAQVCGRLGDHERAERLFREADQLGDDGAAMFNLALAFKRRGLLPQAYDCALKALERYRHGAYLVLQAHIADLLKDTATRDAALEESVGLFGDVIGMSDWELFWFRFGSELRGNQADAQRAANEQKRRRQGQGVPAASGDLPALNPEEKSP
jgi:molecular chaperone DnaK (HSP70)/tetratricopeptide (TPR) repeat protein